MKITVSNHASIRMIERRVNLQDVKTVVKKLDNISKEFIGRIKVMSEIGSKILTVIYKAESKNKITLITTYYES